MAGPQKSAEEKRRIEQQAKERAEQERAEAEQRKALGMFSAADDWGWGRQTLLVGILN